MGWVSEGNLIESTPGTILADTGPLKGIINIVIIIVTEDSSCIVELVKRDEFNLEDVNVLFLPISPVPLFTISLPISLLPNERIILRMRTDLSARRVNSCIQGSILW